MKGQRRWGGVMLGALVAESVGELLWSGVVGSPLFALGASDTVCQVNGCVNGE